MLSDHVYMHRDVGYSKSQFTCKQKERQFIEKYKSVNRASIFFHSSTLSYYICLLCIWFWYTPKRMFRIAQLVEDCPGVQEPLSQCCGGVPAPLPTLIWVSPQILKYMEHYVKSGDARQKIVMGLDTGLGAMFALAGLEVRNGRICPLCIKGQKHIQFEFGTNTLAPLVKHVTTVTYCRLPLTVCKEIHTVHW